MLPTIRYQYNLLQEVSLISPVLALSVGEGPLTYPYLLTCHIMSQLSAHLAAILNGEFLESGAMAFILLIRY